MLLVPGQVLSSHPNRENGRVPHAGRWRLRGIAGSFDYRESVSTMWAPWPSILGAVLALLLFVPEPPKDATVSPLTQRVATDLLEEPPTCPLVRCVTLALW